MLDQLGWQYFCKTGDIDGYLLFRQTQAAETEAPSRTDEYSATDEP